MGRTMRISLDSEGRIVIPRAIREQLGLAPGMTMLIEPGDAQDVRLRLQPEPELIDKGGVLVVRADFVDNPSDAVRDEREIRVRELLARMEP